MRFIALCPFAAALALAAGPQVDFNREIRPILSDNCFACHGPDEKKRQVGLRLDEKDGAFADRGGYRVIVPGDAASSKLYLKITGQDKGPRMPPPGAGRTLTEKQIDLMRRWIDQGAAWETHWAFVPPKRSQPPQVAGAAWPRNPIDRFVLARLEREGIKPSPEADKVALLRRVTLDLTGLPPAPPEVDAFLADRSPNAYESAVDRLLASPRHAERLTMQWLDLARYADTHGYHIDSHRDMWPWRDWVIRAFQNNLPFDRFTIEQLAGDLLPGATLDQKIATGFNRNHMINYEGGAIPEEYLNEYVVDRVETTAMVWMGLTMGCARCHAHKYDPIRQREFYQFYAFFNTISEKGLDGRKGNAEPVVQIPSPEQRTSLDRLVSAIAAREKALPAERELAALQADWEKRRAAALAEAPRSSLAAHYELDGHLADTSGNYLHGKAALGAPTGANGAAGRASDFDGQTQVEFGYAAAPESGRFSLALWVRPTGKLPMTVLAKLDPSDGRGLELHFEEFVKVPDLKRGARLYVRLIGARPGQALELRTRRRLLQSEWTHLVMAYDGSGKASGLRLWVDARPAEVEVLTDRLSGDIGNPAPLQAGVQTRQSRYRGQLDDLRIYHRLLEPPEIERLALHHPMGLLASTDPSKRNKEQREKLRDYFLSREAPQDLRNNYTQLKTLQAEKEELDKVIPTAMVMEEMAKPRETLVLARGDYRNKGEKVTPGVPAALPALPSDAPANRLTLARWLVDPSHPLTARVAVNRFWQMYFGAGLVKTPEDFGSQGEPPVHPELLDWLATEFTGSGWDLRALERLMVTSATYRQSSRLTPPLLQRDPENRLLARGARFRLPAESVRDNALAISGLLVERPGGAGVYPYQPKGVWEEIAYGDVFSAQEYAPGHGPDVYRRSMYTFWKRTAPPPSMATFDAPDREKCVARRARTNTPLQALVLLNDPTYVEAARALAGRMITEAGRDHGRRIDHGFRLATARLPAPRERQALRDLAERQLATYRKDTGAARQLLAVGQSPAPARLDPAELAAWTTVASAILNLDETITKE